MKISLLIILLFFFSLGASSQDLLRRSYRASDTFKGYLENVASTYNLTLKNINIELRRVDFGVAFAYFDPIKHKRYIFLNESFYNDFYSRSEGCKYNAETDKEFLVAGTLAHEFAHHLLGHTFTENTPDQEVLADEVSGIILSRYHNLPNKEQVALSASCLSNGEGYIYKSPTERRKDVLKGWFVAKLNDYLSKNVINQQSSSDLATGNKLTSIKNNVNGLKNIAVNEIETKVNSHISSQKIAISSSLKTQIDNFNFMPDSVISKETINKLINDSQDSTGNIKSVDFMNKLKYVIAYKNKITENDLKINADNYTMDITIRSTINTNNNIKNQLDNNINSLSNTIINDLEKRKNTILNNTIGQYSLTGGKPPTEFKYSFIGNGSYFKIGKISEKDYQIFLFENEISSINTGIRIKPLQEDDFSEIYLKNDKEKTQPQSSTTQNKFYPEEIGDNAELQKLINGIGYPFILKFEVLDQKYYVDYGGWVWRMEAEEINGKSEQVLNCILKCDTCNN